MEKDQEQKAREKQELGQKEQSQQEQAQQEQTQQEQAQKEGFDVFDQPEKGKTKGLFRKGRKLPVKRTAAVLILLALAAAGFFFFRSCQASPAITASAQEASIMDVQQLVTVKGTVEGSDSADVSSPLNYTIRQINVSEGDRVKTGQILAVLEATELKTAYDLAASQYQQALYALEETLKEQQREYEDALRALEASRISYDAYHKLYQEGACAYTEYMQYENDYRAKQAAVDRFTVSQGKVTASAAQRQQLEVERLAMEEKRRALDEVNIKSPIDGTVTRVNATIGKLANDTGTGGATPMFVIEDIDHLQMNVTVGENDIHLLEEGQTVSITGEVLGEAAVEGVVSHISPTGEEQTNNGSSEMVIPVTIDITGENQNLIAGVTAKAEILVNEAPQVLGVSLDSLLEDPQSGETYVLVAGEEGLLEKRVITTGLEGDFYVQVTGGDLAVGEQVILNPGINALTEGMTVTLV